MRESPVQLNLFDPPPDLPAGFDYRAELLSPTDEAGLIACFRGLPFREFEFHGFLGRRRTVSFGLRYDFADRTMHRVEDIPALLLPLRDRAAAFAGLAPALLEHALVTEYTPGAAIGWHRDRPVFGDVIGVSLGSRCRFRFRRPRPGGTQRAASGSRARERGRVSGDAEEGRGRAGAGRAWERASVMLEPRSAYLMRGPARSEWEHSIPPGDALRYSVTFRTMRTE